MRPLAQNDPDLALIVAAWPALPDDVRRTILGVVKLSTPAGAARERWGPNV